MSGSFGPSSTAKIAASFDAARCFKYCLNYLNSDNWTRVFEQLEEFGKLPITEASVDPGCFRTVVFSNDHGLHALRSRVLEYDKLQFLYLVLADKTFLLSFDERRKKLLGELDKFYAMLREKPFKVRLDEYFKEQNDKIKNLEQQLLSQGQLLWQTQASEWQNELDELIKKRRLESMWRDQIQLYFSYKTLPPEQKPINKINEALERTIAELAAKKNQWLGVKIGDGNTKALPTSVGQDAGASLDQLTQTKLLVLNVGIEELKKIKTSVDNHVRNQEYTGQCDKEIVQKVGSIVIKNMCAPLEQLQDYSWGARIKALFYELWKNLWYLSNDTRKQQALSQGKLAARDVAYEHGKQWAAYLQRRSPVSSRRSQKATVITSDPLQAAAAKAG